MDTIEKLTCLQFKPRVSASDYVMITAQGNFSSPVRRRGGRQTVQLGPGCDSQ